MATISINCLYCKVMRKLIYITMAVALNTLASCQDDNELFNVQNKAGQTFYATIENGAGTRTALDENNNVLWSVGDQISVFAGTTDNNAYALKSGDGTKSGEFEANTTQSAGSALSANAAYYPYDSNVTVSESNGSFKFNATFPATQTFSASGTFGNGASPMVAVTTGTGDDDFSFKNVGAIFRIPLKGTATISKIEFSANADLAGACTITASNALTPTVSATEGVKTITLNCGEGVQLSNEKATNFIVAMLPVEIQEGGITISIYDNVGMKMVYTHKAEEAISIERSKAYTTAEVTYTGNIVADVQGALYNATSGTVIQLEPGVNYGTLVFRQNANSKVVDITDAGGDAPGNEHYSKYENITIIGAEGAIVDQIDFQVGWIAGSGASYVDIVGLKVKDVTFSGEKTPFNLEGSKGSALGIDGLTIENCKMNDAEGNDRLVFQQISGYKELVVKGTSEKVMTAGVKNLTITNCEVTGAYMVIESRAMDNLTITDNKFNNIKARDMLITSDVTNHTDITYTGKITITGNTSIEGEERFVRASLNNSDAEVTISGNTIRGYKGADSDFIKVSGANNVTFENNTYEVSTTDNLQNLILNTVDGTIFKLGAETYPALDFTHTYDGSKVTAKNITIQGVTGTEMPKFVSPEGGNSIISWTIKNIKFIGENNGIDVRSSGSNLSVSGCEFTEKANIYVNNEFSNIEIENCRFNGSTTGGVYLQNVSNVNVIGCTFENMLYNAIQLSGAGVAGTVNIQNNIINTCVSRAMRIVTQPGAALAISGNQMTGSNNAADDTEADRGQVIKISGSVLTGTFENNTHNSKNIVFTDGIAIEEN